ncbi:hypothetical protein ILUMI_26643 [Ignelater luminosus]|uniref:RRM domain-containing protein n=1 Tax=Ignelater luminosus TaxID=2038154 RepID=A0A8K0C7L9_IGNLU|nr:hypothetical protein ILUMI_26643 [Ignelater luminosus]
MSSARTYGRNYSSRGDMVVRRLQKLEETTGYPVVQYNAQRICGPPREWNQPAPTNGSEIFISKLPRWLIEDELFKIFSRVGIIYQIRLMMNFTDFNRGFCFITYKTPEQAKMAVEQLNNYPIRPNRHIRVSKSVDNRRLFIGNIMKEKTKEEIKEALECHVDELNDVIVYPPHWTNGQAQNRGYAFAEFATHRDAAIARKLLSSGVKLWIHSPSMVSVDWANPLPEVDPQFMATVKSLYIRNLPYEITKEQLQLCLVEYVHLSNIIKVQKINNYAFIHFQHRNTAEMALSMLNGLTLWGRQIEATWFRPRMCSKENWLNHEPDNFCKSVPRKMRHRLQMLRNGAPPTHLSTADTLSLSSL